MQFRNRLAVLALLGLMDALTGFALLVGGGIIDVGPLHGQIFWLLLTATWCGTAARFLTAGIEDMSSGMRGAIVVAALIVCVAPPVLLARGDVGGILLSALLLSLFLWRGMTITPRDTEHYEVQRRFGLRLGLILFGIVILVARGDTENQSLWLMLSLTGVAYVVAGLSALGLSRLEEARADEEGQGGTLVIGAPVALLVALSFGALALISINILGLFGRVFGPVWDVITAVFAFVLTILALPIYLVALLARHIRLPVRRPLFHVPRAQRHPRLPHSPVHHGYSLTDVITAALVVGAVLVIALVMVALILRATGSRKREELEDEPEDERRSLATPREMVRLFVAWLRSFFRHGVESTARVVEATRHRVLGPSYPADPIRRLYAQLLHRAAREGLQRSATTTPTEFAMHLQRRWPEGATTFTVMTDAYVRRRYAEHPVSADEVQVLRAHWHDLRKIMRSPSSPPPR